MLTPEETAVLQRLVDTPPMVVSAWNGDMDVRLSQDAHSAIVKLLQRELRLQSPDFEQQLHGVVQLATVDTALAVRSVLHVFELVSRAPAPPYAFRVPISRDGHECRATKYYEKLLGFCICVHCAKLPDWERIIETNDRTTP